MHDSVLHDLMIIVSVASNTRDKGGSGLIIMNNGKCHWRQILSNDSFTV